MIICLVIASGTNKMLAKNHAAHKMMMKIKKATSEGGKLTGFSQVKLTACFLW
jgi:hypothetical protein